MVGRQIADLIEQMIDAKIKHHANPDSGGVPELNKIVNPTFIAKLKAEMADLLDSQTKPKG